MSRIGLALAAIYALVCAYFIYTQGLFGESFICLILGIPWSFVLIPVLAAFEVQLGAFEGVVTYTFLLAPMLLNALIFYWIGSKLDRWNWR